MDRPPAPVVVVAMGMWVAAALGVSAVLAVDAIWRRLSG